MGLPGGSECRAERKWPETELRARAGDETSSLEREDTSGGKQREGRISLTGWCTVLKATQKYSRVPTEKRSSDLSVRSLLFPVAFQ